MVEWIPSILVGLLICIFVGFCFYVIYTLESGVDTTKEKQLQAQLDAHANEIQRLMHRCRALEDRLAEIEKRLKRITEIEDSDWSYEPREIRELTESGEEPEEETLLEKYNREVHEKANNIVNRFCEVMTKAISNSLEKESEVEK